ncbi:MAG: hypothetical protein IPG60_05160 [Bacteroidetes bacterium]|nr:hypothetical protein [Bacteroidota bacterium]MBP7400566.1 hypothetical protein [Chitinophagales bacterium]MBK7109104.1 hypothetical protein [Bacteroidota bacterium]MBK8488582.1 hypothetical protein [Bacteroidota bacterium]MBK8681658.1 hypothetical protein [Bacteroidota bacterium]
MLKYTPNNLKRLEGLLNEAGYIVRYEKGNFVSGFCLLETKKVVVVNRFYEIESRINALIEIISQIDLDEERLSEASRDFLKQYNLQTEKS